jgi:hypothetical protein
MGVKMREQELVDMSSGILAFKSCRSCFEAGRRPKTVTGLIAPTTMRIWCAACDRLIIDVELLEPMSMRCDKCGEPVTREHRH